MRPSNSTDSQILFLFPRNAGFPPTRGDAHRVFSIAKLSVNSEIQASVFYLGEGKPFTFSQIQFYPISGKITADPSVASRITFLGLARDFFRFTMATTSFAWKNRRKQTVLYGHTPVGGLVAAVAKLFTGLRFIYDPHDWHYDSWAVYHRSLGPLKRSCAILSYRMLGFILPRVSNTVVCVSDPMVCSIKGANKKILIPNIVEDLPTDDTDLHEENGLVLFVGHLAGYQGLFNLIRAFQFVTATRDGSSLLIVGDGEDKTAAKDLVRRIGLDNVIFTGAVSHDQAYEYTRNVVTDIPEFRDMLKGYGNAKFAEATPEGLAQTIIAALESPLGNGSPRDFDMNSQTGPVHDELRSLFDTG